MRILLLAHSFNSLTQRLHVELRARGYEVSLELDINDAVTREAVSLFRPDLVIAPFLKRAIPQDVFEAVPCFVVHPGPPGDRGPSALDWAVLDGAAEWGVTVLQAVAVMDAGPIWAHFGFPMRDATKSSLYRNEVTEAAVAAVLQAIERFESGVAPSPQADGSEHPPCRQADRAIDWRRDSTWDVLRKIRSADGDPGVEDEMFGLAVRLFDAHAAVGLGGEPGAVVSRSQDAICRATTDGAVWIGHLRPLEGPYAGLKLPAATVLADHLVGIPEMEEGIRRIAYDEAGDAGFLEFAFYNGAMSVAECETLRDALRSALARPTRVLTLTGGPDYWSNGIDLSRIEAADSPADESWRNINAMNDLVRDIIAIDDRLVVSAMRGNAGAGGVFLALAADRVWAREGIVLSPHYKDMGNLYGSEYWSYLLPRRCGAVGGRSVMAARTPMGVKEASAHGLVDAALPDSDAALRDRAIALAAAPDFDALLAEKQACRAADEAEKPLEEYRRDELARMRLNFYGFDPSYHVARYNFIRKAPKSRTPAHLAVHRDGQVRKEAAA